MIIMERSPNDITKHSCFRKKKCQNGCHEHKSTDLVIKELEEHGRALSQTLSYYRTRGNICWISQTRTVRQAPQNKAKIFQYLFMWCAIYESLLSYFWTLILLTGSRCFLSGSDDTSRNKNDLDAPNRVFVCVHYYPE